MTNPHELINLRGYGSAEKALLKAGLWRDTVSDTERIDWLDRQIISVTNAEDDKCLIDGIVGMYWGGGIRGRIDAVSGYFDKAMEATT